MKNNQIRQGDVMLFPVNENEIDESKLHQLPDAIKNNRVVLAEGEATGHAHTVCADCASLFSYDGRPVLVVNTATEVQHQEHTRVEIQTGIYWVVRQREYAPRGIRRVAD